MSQRQRSHPLAGHAHIYVAKYQVKETDEVHGINLIGLLAGDLNLRYGKLSKFVDAGLKILLGYCRKKIFRRLNDIDIKKLWTALCAVDDLFRGQMVEVKNVNQSPPQRGTPRFRRTGQGLWESFRLGSSEDARRSCRGWIRRRLFHIILLRLQDDQET